MALYNKSEDRLDRVLGDALRDHRIEQGVPTWDSFHAARRVKVVRMRRILASSAAAFLALVVSVGGLMVFDQGEMVVGRIEIPAIALPQKSQITDRPELIAQAQYSPQRSASSVMVLTAEEQSVEAPQNEPKSIEGTMKSTVKIDPKSDLQGDPKSDQKPQKDVENRPKSTDYRSTDGLYDAAQPIGRMPKQRAKISMGLFSDMGYGVGQSSAGIAASPTTMQAQVGKYSSRLNFTEREFSHKFPISVGVSLQFELIRNLSIETGLMYSYLESTAMRKPDMLYRYSRQTHYVGIPLALQYTFFNHRRLDLYASMGGMAEYAIASQGISSVYAADNQVSEDRQPLGTNGVVWSVNAFVGINIHITPTVGIYIQPGASHYFKNDSHPINFRTESEVQFDLRAGIKIKI